MRVIRNDTKPRIRRVFLHDPSQRHLCRRSHSIRLIQDNQLERAKRIVARTFGEG